MDDRIRNLPIFDGVTDGQLDELVAGAEEVSVAPGTVVFAEGEPAEVWWVLIDGVLELSRHVGREDVVVGRMDVPGRWAGGFRAWDPQGSYLATGRCVEPGHLLRVPAEVLRDRMSAWFPLGGHLINGLYGTARSIESTARQRDSLVTLGTLAAGLAHELNNPAAAATRSVQAMEDACASLVDAIGRLALASLSVDQFLELERLRRELVAREPLTSALDLSDREEELADWAEDYGLDGAWTLMPPLAAQGADVTWCRTVAELLPRHAVQPGLQWVAGMLSLYAVLGEVRDATHRISELVGSVRSYTQMDRAGAQRVLVTEGLDNTLVMLGHKLGRGIEVVKEYDADLPQVEAFPGELNQVWTNLIDNATDAIGEQGRLRVTARADGDGVVVEIADSGPGLPPEVAARAFDAFYTTKEVGRGTGLGLDIARRIVVERHGGTIEIDRVDGETVLRVRLPA